ncbi:DUF397 domain-containing protein [Streptomyces sp. P38-E01]|uniref:DUF397 domain-containing protein n=1 Tax=Streptomyces tardus TaxID=2780544 RepID=A0A949N0R6_9ACTN|nr:DUF397 domain-containing protein [Streptomyces tardus]MBU7596990.1 DUF397 domain-containing protein [Streptomyces tardus]
MRTGRGTTTVRPLNGPLSPGTSEAKLTARDERPIRDEHERVPRWLTSSCSNNGGDCVEVAAGRTVAQVRDSKNVGGPALAVPASQWTAFLSHLRTDRPGL